MHSALPAASPWRRLLCMLYEFVILFALVFVVGLLLPMALLPLAQRAGLTAVVQGPWFWRLIWMLVLGAVAGYFVRSWTRGGQTLAMRAWRLRLVMEGDRPLDWRQAATRLCLLALCFGGPVLTGAWYRHQPSVLPYFAASCVFLLVVLAWAWLDDDRRFLYDRLTATRTALLPPCGAKR
ncbi:RDD family protein [Chitinivorax sp. PXF-14]|uniref:RDD family protein n=1 Tax=Chitinivorax sp. PXF-14 TaxID=3230488 RepID=UPI0034678E0B